MTYKPHIDGLRALAVLPVVAFHLDISALPGGFTGVDVFFVISGYLITGTIVSDLGKGRFSILEFYKRRILRILPALAAVILFVMAVAAMLMLPLEVGAIGRSAAASALFVSNILFWQTSDYFAGSAEANPLLHTWSLSVEEQFYVVFPLLMVLLARYARGRFLLPIAAGTVLSLALCVAATATSPTFAFYAIPTRAWELGIGACLALAPGLGGRGPRPLLAALGAVLVCGSFLLITEEGGFPGAVALFPCLGAALLIGCAEGTRVGRFLSGRVMVWIGSISYSLYLWHWPLIVFYKMRFETEMESADNAMLFAASVAMAALSTRFIERPFRLPSFRGRRAGRVVVTGSAVLAGLAAMGIALSVRPDLLHSYPPDVVKLASYGDYGTRPAHNALVRSGTCMIGEEQDLAGRSLDESCLALDPGRPDILLIGDSHAAQYWAALQEAFPEANVLQATASGCRPLLDGTGDRFCTELMDHVLKDVLQPGQIDAVIFAGRWKQKDLALVPATLAHVAARTKAVVVLGPGVEYFGELPTLLARTLLRGGGFDWEEHLDRRRAEVSRMMAGVVPPGQATYVPVYEELCGSAECTLTTPEGIPLQFDYGHLTKEGARYLVSRIEPELREALF